MPYLPTSQAYLEQSSLLLQAYPNTTRITTKYSFPSKSQRQKPSSQPDPSAPSTPAAAAPIATLTLKTFNPTSGICLKYRTNKAAEVGRLITSLGKLAGGADVASLGLSGPTPAVATGGDIEMTDAPEESATAADAANKNNTSNNNPAAQTSGKGGKSKKKGGKGKR